MIVRILIEFNFNMTHITTGLISFLMVFILVMQGNVSRTIPEGAINNMITDFECNRDDECLENDTYCDVSLNLCSQCLDCNNYFRMPKKEIKCPKNVSDCSICLNGYMEETFFSGEIRDLCVPNDSIILPTPEKISSNFYWQDVGIIFIIINMFLIFLLWTYIYKRIWNTNVHTSNVLQDNIDILPPSYDSCLKTDNYVTDDVQEFHLFTGEQPSRNEWRHQNAVPFRLQEDTQDNSNHIDENENIEEVDGVVMREIEDPEIHDEETMPSVWTPPPLPPSPESRNAMTRFQNNRSQFCSPPFKRIRLESVQSTNDKNEDNEDYASDMSQD